MTNAAFVVVLELHMLLKGSAIGLKMCGNGAFGMCTGSKD